MIVDRHSHLSLPMDQKVARMDAASIDRAILVVATGHPETATDAGSYLAETSNARRHIGWDGTDPYVHQASEEALRAGALHPDRFVVLAPAMFGTDRDRIEAWTQAALHAGCYGFGEVMASAGRADLLETNVAAAHDAGGLLFLTSSYPPTTAEDLKAYADLARRYPSNVFVLGHLGAGHTLLACELAASCPNVFIDTSTHLNIIALRRCVAQVPGKLLFGTNDPYCDPVVARLNLSRTITDAGLLRAIEGEHCSSIFDRLDGVRLRSAG